MESLWIAPGDGMLHLPFPVSVMLTRALRARSRVRLWLRADSAVCIPLTLYSLVAVSIRCPFLVYLMSSMHRYFSTLLLHHAPRILAQCIHGFMYPCISSGSKREYACWPPYWFTEPYLTWDPLMAQLTSLSSGAQLCGGWLHDCLCSLL